MDATDELARKLIEAFESLEEEIVLEQLAVPEDPGDPTGSVDLWVASAGAFREQEDQFVVRGQISVPTWAVAEREVGDLVRFFRQELLYSEQFRAAIIHAGIASRAAERGGGMPSPEEAECN